MSKYKVGDKLPVKHDPDHKAEVIDILNDGLVKVKLKVLGKYEVVEHTEREIRLIYNV